MFITLYSPPATLLQVKNDYLSRLQCYTLAQMKVKICVSGTED